MDRSKARTIVGILCVVALVGVAVALAAPSIGDAPADPAAPGSCFEFSRDVDPKQVPVDSGYDPDKDIVYAHAAGRTYVLRPGDPACRVLSGTRAVIEDAVGTSRENEAVACRQVADSLARGRTEARGRTIDREAARRFLEQRCGRAG